jgi:two-component system NarL family sensor kinase
VKLAITWRAPLDRPAVRTGLAAVVAVVIVLLAATEVATYVTLGPPAAERSLAAVELCQYVLQGSSMAVVGFLILAKARAPSLGWMLLVSAFAFAAAACLSTWLRFATQVTTPVRLAVYAEYVLWQLPRMGFILTPLCFPNGRLPGRWARWLAIVVTAAIGIHEVDHLITLEVWHPGAATMRNDVLWSRWQPVTEAMRIPLEVVAYAGTVLATLSPVLRWRHAGPVARRQIAIAVPVFLLLIVEEGLRLLYVWSGPVAVARIAVAVLWPAAIGYVIVRDRLYALDRAARRVVAVAVPVVLLAAVYGAAASALSAVMPGASPALATALAILAALVGLVLRPIGRGLARRVDRLLYGDRAEPYQVARRLAGRLREGVDPAQVPVAVCQIVVSGLRLPGAALDAPVGGQVGRLAAVGELGGAVLEPFELRYQGETVGCLRVAPRTGQARLDELDRAALRPLADLAAPAVSALRLQKELTASRALLASVREEERHRLRRDVHDGVGPSLAAIRLRVDTAAALLPAGSASVSLLADVSLELGRIDTEMRRIIRQLPALPPDWNGLPANLGELVDRLSSPALPVELEVAARLPALPPAVEVAAYRIAAEALTNAVRHSGASRATVRVVLRDETLMVTITDDGTGIRTDAPAAGMGLVSMNQRAAEVGGECRIDSNSDGTVVCARLPVARPR